MLNIVSAYFCGKGAAITDAETLEPLFAAILQLWGI